MALSVTAYGNLKVSPYKILNLLNVELIKEINEHSKLRFTGVLEEDSKDSYVEATKPQSEIELSQVDDDGGSTVIFKGTVLNVEIKSVRGVYYIDVYAISNTYSLDITRKSRSFQDIGMTYSALVDKVVSEYPGADVKDEASNGKTTGQFIMQYNETDWQFLKRMVSHFNSGLIPASTYDKPKFYFGIPKSGPSKGKLEDFHYSMYKDISMFRELSENGVQGISEIDFVYYEAETDKILEVGDKVDFKGKNLYVSKVVTTMKEGLLKHQYILASKEGLSRKKLHNEAVIGLSVEGNVIDVAKDTVKVHMDIDKLQDKGTAYWFPYSTVYTAEGNSGWYCMPELGDQVRVYFSDKDEGNGIALSSVRKHSQQGDKFDNPDVKYFRTKAGKELMLSPEEILITAKDGEIYIRLNENNGIEIFSKKEIKFISEEDIMMDSGKKVVISAKEQIKLTCKDSNIEMSDSGVDIKGKEVKTN